MLVSIIFTSRRPATPQPSATAFHLPWAHTLGRATRGNDGECGSGLQPVGGLTVEGGVAWLPRLMEFSHGRASVGQTRRLAPQERGAPWLRHHEQRPRGFSAGKEGCRALSHQPEGCNLYFGLAYPGFGEGGVCGVLRAGGKGVTAPQSWSPTWRG